MKKILILLVALTAITAKAQTKADADSLLVVKTYLEKIQTTVNSKLAPKEKVAVMDSLIRLATPYQHVLEKHLLAFVTTGQTRDMVSEYLLIAGSLVIYKMDIKSGGYKEPTQKPNKDVDYINTHVPKVANKLEHYAAYPKKP